MKKLLLFCICLGGLFSLWSTFAGNAKLPDMTIDNIQLNTQYSKPQVWDAKVGFDFAIKNIGLPITLASNKYIILTCTDVNWITMFTKTFKDGVFSKNTSKAYKNITTNQSNTTFLFPNAQIFKIKCTIATKGFKETNTANNNKTFSFKVKDKETTNMTTPITLSVSSNQSLPDLNQWVNLTIKALNNSSVYSTYTGAVKFQVKYKQSPNDSWQLAPSSYYERSSNFGNTITFSAGGSDPDNGQKTLQNFIKFKKAYYFQIIVSDINTSSNVTQWTAQFDVSSNNMTSINLWVSSNQSLPNISQWVNLTVKALDNGSIYSTYNGTIQFQVMYRVSPNDSWQLAPWTYFERSPNFGNTITFSAEGSDPDNWQITLQDFIKFEEPYYFQIIVSDINASSNVSPWSAQFTVD